MTYKLIQLNIGGTNSAHKKSLVSFGVLLDTEKSKNPVIGRLNPHLVHLKASTRKNSILKSIGRQIRSSEVEKMAGFISQTNAKKLRRTVEFILCLSILTNFREFLVTTQRQS